MSYWEDEDNVYDDEDNLEEEPYDDEELDDDERENRKSDSKIICEYCGLKGHTSLDCPSIND